MKKLILVLVLQSWCLCHAQNIDTTHHIKVRKNVIQGSAGFIYFFAGAQFNYERQLIQFKDNSLSGLWANAGVGAWGVIHAWGPFQHLSAGLMSGHKNNHFELTIGISRYKTNVTSEIDGGMSNPASDEPSEADFIPIGSVGYRFQKPEGGFVFRCGLAFPPTPYFGFGLAF